MPSVSPCSSTKRKPGSREASARPSFTPQVNFALLASMGSPYLGWDYADPETAVFGTAFHVFEYVFVRAAPLVLIASIAGAVLTRKKN